MKQCHARCQQMMVGSRALRALLVVAWTLLGAGAVGAATADFVNFESGQVRPLALAPDGSALSAR